MTNQDIQCNEARDSAASGEQLMQHTSDEKKPLPRYLITGTDEAMVRFLRACAYFHNSEGCGPVIISNTPSTRGGPDLSEITLNPNMAGVQRVFEALLVSTGIAAVKIEPDAPEALAILSEFANHHSPLFDDRIVVPGSAPAWVRTCFLCRASSKPGESIVTHRPNCIWMQARAYRGRVGLSGVV